MIEKTILPERNLDVMRAFGVLMVIATHTVWLFTTRHWGTLAIWNVGRFGLLMFFLHTSLVLMASLERLAAVGREGRALWINFYIRRAFRIYPLAIAVILLIVAFNVPTTLRPHVNETPWSTVLANLGLVQNLVGRPSVMGVMWSLPVEVQMYVFLPALFLIARAPHTSGRIMALMLAVVSALGILAVYLPMYGMGRLNVIPYAPCFVAGVLAYWVAHRIPPRFPAWSWPLVMAGTTGIFLLKCDSHNPVFSHGWIACIALSLLLPLVHDLPETVVTRVAHWIAKYSYGFYLFHMPVAAALVKFPVLMRPYIYLVLVPLLTGVVAMIGYHLIEAPMIRFGAKLTTRRVRQRAMPAFGEELASNAPAP